MGMISSENLYLRPISQNDSPFILKLLNEDAYIKSIRDSGIRTLEDAESFITNTYLESYRSNGFGLYLVATHEDTKVGICGVVKREHLDIPDLGFAISETYQKKNYATEASKLVLQFAKNKLGLQQIAGITTEENIGSQKVLLRSGFVLQGNKNINGKDFLYYNIKF